jgi:hypothetical protein
MCVAFFNCDNSLKTVCYAYVIWGGVGGVISLYFIVVNNEFILFFLLCP